MAKVLVLDDSPVARAAATRAASDRGHAVVTASSIDEADRIDAASLGAAILDVDIGQTSGVDFAARLRFRRPDLPIAFLTATSDPLARERAETFGPVFDKTRGVDDLEAWLSRIAP